MERNLEQDMVGELKLYSVHDSELRCLWMEVTETFKSIPLNIFIEMEEQLKAFSLEKRNFTTRLSPYLFHDWIIFVQSLPTEESHIYIVSARQMQPVEIGGVMPACSNEAVQFQSFAINYISHVHTHIISSLDEALNTLKKLEYNKKSSVSLPVDSVISNIKRNKGRIKMYEDFFRETQVHPQIKTFDESIAELIISMKEVAPEIASWIDVVSEKDTEHFVGKTNVLIDNDILIVALFPLLDWLYQKHHRFQKIRTTCCLKAETIELTFHDILHGSTQDDIWHVYMYFARIRVSPFGLQLHEISRDLVVSMTLVEKNKGVIISRHKTRSSIV